MTEFPRCAVCGFLLTDGQMKIGYCSSECEREGNDNHD